MPFVYTVRVASERLIFASKPVFWAGNCHYGLHKTDQSVKVILYTWCAKCSFSSRKKQECYHLSYYYLQYDVKEIVTLSDYFTGLLLYLSQGLLYLLHWNIISINIQLGGHNIFSNVVFNLRNLSVLDESV